MGQLCSCHSGKVRDSKDLKSPLFALLPKNAPFSPLSQKLKGKKPPEECEGNGQVSPMGHNSSPIKRVESTSCSSTPESDQTVDRHKVAEAERATETASIAAAHSRCVAKPPVMLRRRATCRMGRSLGAQSLTLPSECEENDSFAAEPWVRKRRVAQARVLAEPRYDDVWGHERFIDDVKEWLCDRLEPWNLFNCLQKLGQVDACLAVELGRCTSKYDSCRCMLDFLTHVRDDVDGGPHLGMLREILSVDASDDLERVLEFIDVVDQLLSLGRSIRSQTSTEDTRTSYSEELLPSSSSGNDVTGEPFSNSTDALSRASDGYFRSEIVKSSATRPCLYEFGYGSVDCGAPQFSSYQSFTRRRHSDLCHSDGALSTGSTLQHDELPAISVSVYKMELNAEYFRKLARVLTDHGHVRHLSFVRSHLPTGGFAELCDVFGRQSPGVARFDFRMRHLANDDVTHLSNALRGATSLTCLNLASTGLGGEACRRLVAALGASCAANRVLSELDLGYNELEDEGCCAVAELIEMPGCWLRKLQLHHNGIGPAGMRRLAASLRSHPRLMSLDVSSNVIGDDGAASLLEALLGNRTLRDVIVDDCGVTAEGCRHMARTLTTNSVLRSLSLSRNAIGEAGVRSLAEGLRYNRTLEVLGLNMCCLGNDGFVCLLQELSWCHSIRIVKVCYNSIGVPAGGAGIAGGNRRWSSVSYQTPPDTSNGPASSSLHVASNSKLASEVYRQMCEMLRVNPKLKIYLWGNSFDCACVDVTSVSDFKTETRTTAMARNWRRSQTVASDYCSGPLS